jgi:hypothetical protein
VVPERGLKLEVLSRRTSTILYEQLCGLSSAFTAKLIYIHRSWGGSSWLSSPTTRFSAGLPVMHNLFLPHFLASFFQQGTAPLVKVQGSLCTVIPSGGDDSAAIVSAFEQCSQDATVLFTNATYHINKIMHTHGLKNVTVDVRGTLLVRGPAQLNTPPLINSA